MNKQFHKTTLLAFAIISMLLPQLLVAQNKTPGCADIKNGSFYYYPKNSADRYLETRDNSYLRELNSLTGDSVLWQIKWSGDCEYTLKFISTNAKKMTDDKLTLLQKHKFIYQVISVTNDYYVFKGFLDKTSNPPIQTDTMWLKEKAIVANNQLFKQMPNNAFIKRNHFSDTSKYAVLYVYRPKKLSNSLGSYLIYFDDNLMCVAQNNTGYIFKILKEGLFDVKSKLYKDEASTKLDVKFGNTYYVKSMIHWAISSRLYNFRLEMATMKPEDGKKEFEEVDLQ